MSTIVCLAKPSKETSIYYVITKGRGVRKWQFFYYCNHEARGGGSKKPKSWLRNTWMVPNVLREMYFKTSKYSGPKLSHRSSQLIKIQQLQTDLEFS